MDYEDSLRWLLTLPDFERTGDFAARPDLAPMLALLHELSDPHLDPRPTIHIAGSKGKGSTGAMIEAVLRHLPYPLPPEGEGRPPQAGGARALHTGHYISPHLHRYTERIRIDGQPIAPEEFAAAMTAVREAMDLVTPKFPDRHLLAFDALTAAAFVAFREAHVDVQVIEVGLGGLLDSTNVFHQAPPLHAVERGSGGEVLDPPHIVVLTPISLEHTAILGDTVQAIARQKAGIITEGCTVVVAPQRESAIDVFTEIAREQHATLIEVAKVCQLQRISANAEGQDFRLKTPRETYAAHLPLAGRHQLDNAATATVAVEELLNKISPLPSEGEGSGVRALRDGLATLVWPGRLETLKRKPTVIVDGAHNGDSVKRMVAALREDFGLKSAVLLYGTLAGKDVASMAEQAAPFASAIFITAWPSPRAADPRELATVFRPHDAPVTTFGALPEAYEAAIAEAGPGGTVVAFGALAFIAAVREYVLGIEGDRLLLEPHA